jgi:flavin-binding protein dodecin
VDARVKPGHDGGERRAFQFCRFGVQIPPLGLTLKCDTLYAVPSDFSFDHLTHAGKRREKNMPESVYKVIELVGTSTESWEKAAKAAIDRAAKSLRDLRIAEIVAQDMVLKNGKVEAYRAKVKVSFKFEGKG